MNIEMHDISPLYRDDDGTIKQSYEKIITEVKCSKEEFLRYVNNGILPKEYNNNKDFNIERTNESSFLFENASISANYAILNNSLQIKKMRFCITLTGDEIDNNIITITHSECSKCKGKILSEHKYCPNCGEKVIK